jgi:hypothetical protein
MVGRFKGEGLLAGELLLKETASFFGPSGG